MPKPAKLINDPGLLEAALEGLELQKQRIDSQIREVRALLGRRRSPASVTTENTKTAPRKRQLSEAARKRIAAAQRKRWAEYRKASGQGKAE
jgi:hypothetical protein